MQHHSGPCIGGMRSSLHKASGGPRPCEASSSQRVPPLGGPDDRLRPRRFAKRLPQESNRPDLCGLGQGEGRAEAPCAWQRLIYTNRIAEFVRRSVRSLVTRAARSLRRSSRQGARGGRKRVWWLSWSCPPSSLSQSGMVRTISPCIRSRCDPGHKPAKLAKLLELLLYN